MKKGDFIWAFILLLWILILAVPASRIVFISVTGAYPYTGGFVKFAILATMGDLLGTRIHKGKWIIPEGIVYKVIVWGLIGMMITLLFTLFMGGAAAAQAAGRLPFRGSTFAQAFFGSAVMNLTFGPMMMVFHRFTDVYLETRFEKNSGRISMNELIDRIDWHSMVKFSWIKTCPLFWIPAHTIVFLLPEQYRVITSAFLSIALGVMMAISKKSKVSSDTYVA